MVVAHEGKLCLEDDSAIYCEPSMALAYEKRAFYSSAIVFRGLER